MRPQLPGLCLVLLQIQLGFVLFFLFFLLQSQNLAANLPTGPASPTCWDPKGFLGKFPEIPTSEPSHWEGTPGKSLESSPGAKFLHFKSLPLLPRQWDWLEEPTFDFLFFFRDFEDFHLHFCAPTQIQVGSGSQLNVALLSWSTRGESAAGEMINYSTFTSKPAWSTRVKISRGERGPQQSSLSISDWFWAHLNRGVWYTRSLRKGGAEREKESWEDFRIRLQKLKIKKNPAGFGFQKNPGHILPLQLRSLRCLEDVE